MNMQDCAAGRPVLPYYLQGGLNTLLISRSHKCLAGRLRELASQSSHGQLRPQASWRVYWEMGFE